MKADESPLTPSRASGHVPLPHCRGLIARVDKKDGTVGRSVLLSVRWSQSTPESGALKEASHFAFFLSSQMMLMLVVQCPSPKSPAFP